MVTDRPDQTESASLVPPGYFQLEAGFTFSDDDSDEDSPVESFEGFDTLARIGLVDWLELRIGWIPRIEETRGSSPDRLQSSGIGDAGLGVKARLRHEDGAAPAMALIVGTTLPIGAEEFSSERFDPSLILAASHTLSDRLGLGYNLGFQRASLESVLGRRESNTDFTFSLALGLAGGPRAGYFIELLGNRNVDGDDDSNLLTKAGITYKLSPNFQLDAVYTHGLNEAAVDSALGFGISLRLPR